MQIDTEVDLEVEDCVDFLKNTNSHVQLVFLMDMAKLYYNHPSEFKMQLQHIQYELCTEMSHDTRNMIRYMIDDLSDYLGSEAILGYADKSGMEFADMPTLDYGA